MRAETVSLARLDSMLAALHAAIASEVPRSRCLRRWSEFVRLRDGYTCVCCKGQKRLAAHHILRKSLVQAAQYEPGNGITLCSSCHREAHRGFNGRADLALPFDWQGGEKLPLMERLYALLLADAQDRGLLREDFYHLGSRTLGTLRVMQGRNPADGFTGTSLEEAVAILSGSDLHVASAIAEANGLDLSLSLQLPGGARLYWN